MANDNWRTPKWLFDAASKMFGGFALDAAADDENHLCAEYYTEQRSGLENPWSDKGLTWCNPPYSNIEPWVEKAIKERQLNDRGSVLLLPSRTGRLWFEELMKKSQIVFLVGGRVKFIDPTDAGRSAPTEDSLFAFIPPYGVIGARAVGNMNIKLIAPEGEYKS